jgi:hypothetical protein
MTSRSQFIRFDDFRNLLAAFERHGVKYVLIGGMALAAHGLPRATRDVDFFVEPGEENVERLKAALKEVYRDDSVEELTSEDLAHDAAVVRYGPPDQEFLIIDFVGHLGTEFTFDDIESQQVDIDGVSTAVATPRMLYRMKHDTVRPQDQVDAANLDRKFNLFGKKTAPRKRGRGRADHEVS